MTSNNAITINISLSQVAAFFTISGAATIVIGSILLDEWSRKSGWGSVSNKLIGCTSAVLVGGIVQTLSSLYLYFKASFKQFWIYTQVGVILLFIICFSILLATTNSSSRSSNFDAFFAVLGINWIISFLTIGLLSKNSVPVSILFSIFGVAVIISCSLVIDEFASSRWGTSAGNKIIGCASAALVAAIAETISSAFLFLKDDIKNIWSYVNGLVTIVFITCFAIPFAADISATTTSYYYTTLAINFVFLFVVVGMFTKNRFWKH